MYERYKKEGRLNIVLVEDDDADAKAVQRAFQKSAVECQILRARDGIEALAILRNKEDHAGLQRPYLLIVDLNMPRMDGIEFIRAIRLDPGLKHSIVFVLSTSGRPEDVNAAYDLHVAGYIAKATASTDYSGLVKMLSHYWRFVEIP
jgi:CheY-like chemotaxis protein